MTDFSAGSYKVAVLSEVAGKKVNARFNLNLCSFWIGFG
jgi:hypothetical protein